MGNLCSRHLIKTIKQQQLVDDDGFDIPTEIITDEILSRLPVKSILRLRSVSKPWLSWISDPTFTKLQLTRASTALFIPAFGIRTHKLHMFSANDDGGSLTHLMTLHPKRSDLMQIETEHLNGLVLLTLKYTHLNYYEAVVVNPSTRKMLKLDYGASGTLEHAKFFFGFDESANEHKILRACGDVESTTTFEIMGLSRSNYSWRKIDATFDIGQYIWSPDIRFDRSVCVNSVIHFMLRSTSEILAFDLRTETISIIKAPPYDKTERNFWTSPYLMRINGCNIGVVRSPRLVVTNIMHIWILKDYEHHVWAKETIIFIYPNFLKESGLTFQLDYGSTGEIIFAPTNFGSVITAPIYNMKSRRFKTVSFTLDHPLPGLKDLKGLRVYQVKRYLESILPLLAT